MNRQDFLRALERHGLAEGDVIEGFTRSSGPGGQHVNKVSTAVTLRCPARGIIATAQDSRSQADNRATARQRFIEELESRAREQRAARRSEIEKARRRNRRRPRGLKERMLETKRRRATVKKGRARQGPDA